MRLSIKLSLGPCHLYVMEKKNLRRGRDGIRNSESRSPCKKSVAEATSLSPIQVLSAPFCIGPYYDAQLIRG